VAVGHKAFVALVQRVLHENLLCVRVDHLAPRVRREDALETRRAVPVVLSVAAARIGATPRSRSWGIEVRRRDQYKSRLSLARCRCSPYALACKQAPLASAVTSTILGCAERDPVAFFLGAPLPASVTSTILGCAERDPVAFFLGAPLPASVSNTKIGRAFRLVWLTSRMRAAQPCDDSVYDRAWRALRCLAAHRCP
jgi:hypothetical protein